MIWIEYILDSKPQSDRSFEYLFVDRGEQLRKLNCHVVYTIPLALSFSNEREALKNRLGGGMAPKVLPMVPVQLRDGSEFQRGEERNWRGRLPNSIAKSVCI